jgi:hypothetical protein
MNRYQLIRGFDTWEKANEYAKALPEEAIAKVVPYSTGKNTHAFAVDVSSGYTGGRI